MLLFAGFKIFLIFFRSTVQNQPEVLECYRPKEKLYVIFETLAQCVTEDLFSDFRKNSFSLFYDETTIKTKKYEEKS